jgi:hypothetical protein
MFNRKLFVFFLILLCIAGISFAQDGNKTGIGVAIIDLEKLFEVNMSNGAGTYATITIPIITSPGFRIEPEVGYFRAAQ